MFSVEIAQERAATWHAEAARWRNGAGALRRLRSSRSGARPAPSFASTAAPAGSAWCERAAAVAR
jgi:hypothetical protein